MPILLSGAHSVPLELHKIFTLRQGWGRVEYEAFGKLGFKARRTHVHEHIAGSFVLHPP